MALALPAFVLALSLAALSSAQTSADLQGRVYDASGAVIAGASGRALCLTEPHTGISGRSTSSFHALALWIPTMFRSPNVVILCVLSWRRAAGHDARAQEQPLR